MCTRVDHHRKLWRNLYGFFCMKMNYIVKLPVRYTCNLWSNYIKQHYIDLRKQFYNAFRGLLGLARYCSALRMYAEARIDGFEVVVRKRVASLFQQPPHGDSRNDGQPDPKTLEGQPCPCKYFKFY